MALETSRNLEADLDLGFLGSDFEVEVETGVDLGVGLGMGRAQVAHWELERAEFPFAKFTAIVVVGQAEVELEAEDLANL